MPERNHEVVIDGYVFPDTVTVTLANDEYINSRDYVSKELYESVDGANDVWQAENAELRELAAGIGHLLFTLDIDYCATCPRDGINHPCPAYAVNGGECLYKIDLRELGVEVDG